MDSWDGPPDSNFDADYAAGFLGKYLLVGITVVSNANEVLSREQKHGIIVALTEGGIDVELSGVNTGQRWRMPPCLADLSPARPGTYTLSTTGEQVEDPDFTCSLTVRKPAHQ